MEHSPYGKRIGVVAAYARLHANLLLAQPNAREIDHGALARVLKDIAAWLERLATDASPCGPCPLKTQGGEQR